MKAQPRAMLLLLVALLMALVIIRQQGADRGAAPKTATPQSPPAMLAASAQAQSPSAAGLGTALPITVLGTLTNPALSVGPSAPTVHPSAALPPNIEHTLVWLYHSVGSNAVQRPSDAVGRKPRRTTSEAFDQLGARLQMDDENRALVSIRTSGAIGPVMAGLERLGAIVHLSREPHRLIEAWIRADALPAAAGLSGVLAISPVYRPIALAGSVQTQGDAVVHADAVRAQDFTGAPLLVGVLSDSKDADELGGGSRDRSLRATGSGNPLQRPSGLRQWA